MQRLQKEAQAEYHYASALGRMFYAIERAMNPDRHEAWDDEYVRITVRNVVREAATLPQPRQKPVAVTPEDLCEFLVMHGITATLEHPGYVDVSLRDGKSFNIGTANEEWGLDFVECTGSPEQETVATSVVIGGLDTSLDELLAEILRYTLLALPHAPRHHSTG